MSLPAESELSWHLARVERALARGRRRSRWVLLIAIPALTGIFCSIDYHHVGIALFGDIAIALGTGGLLLIAQMLARQERRPLSQTLREPGEVFDFFLSPDRGLVFFNEEGCFIEKTRTLWTYNGTRVRIWGIDFEDARHLLRLLVAGVVGGQTGGALRWLNDQIAIRVPSTLAGDRAEKLLEKVASRLAPAPGSELPQPQYKSPE